MTGGTEARLCALRRYPVKACAAEDLREVHVGEAGLLHDRWLAVVVDGAILTQRECPRLARIRPALDDATVRLTLSLDDLAPLTCTVTTDGPPETVTLFGDPVVVVDQGPGPAAWLGDVLGGSARLVAAPESSWRISPGEVSGLTVLSDEGTVSVHSRASLDRLNAALADGGGGPLPDDRFRTNLVLEGCEPHAEDTTTRFEVGDDLVMRFAQVDERCVVTTVDQTRGERAGAEPLRTLAAYRRDPSGGGVLFGVYTAVETPGLVRLGDRVVLHGA